MALVLNDRVKETTTTTGTGTVNLAGAETGFETFVAGIGNSNTCYYAIVHQTADEFEVGLGTVTDASPDTLARTTVISSSNSDSAVNFSAGTKDVFCTLPASKAVFIDGSGDLSSATLGITNTTTDDSLLITTTEDSSTAAPVITLKRNSSSPADNDYLGQLKFKGENDADQEVIYAKITGKISDASDTTEDGLLEFTLKKAGSNNIGARLTSTDLKLINGTGLEVAGDVTISGAFTSQGIDDNADATAITIDSSENITTSGTFQVGASSGANLLIDSSSDVMQVKAKKDGTDDIDLVFLTQASGGALGEKMRIASDGKVGINTSSPSVKLEVQEAVASTYTARFMHTGNPNSGPPQILKLEFYNTPNNGTSEFLKCRDTLSGTPVNRAVIMSNGGIVNYTSNDSNYSDERMKKDINNATAQLDNIKKLQLKTFRYKEQEASEPTNLGVVAQDIQTHFPALVTEQGEGDEARLGVKEQQIMWMAIKAIQEQQEQIEALQSEINTLKEG